MALYGRQIEKEQLDEPLLSQARKQLTKAAIGEVIKWDISIMPGTKQA